MIEDGVVFMTYEDDGQAPHFRSRKLLLIADTLEQAVEYQRALTLWGNGWDNPRLTGYYCQEWDDNSTWQAKHLSSQPTPGPISEGVK